MPKLVNQHVQRVLDRNHLPNPWDKQPRLLPGGLPELDWHDLSHDDHGWFNFENADMLDRLMRERGVKVVVELGSWLGKSTRFLSYRSDLVVAIDTWEGSPEHHEPGRTDVAHRLPRLFDQFLANCHEHVNICPVRLRTGVACTILDLPVIDLVYVDADHSYDAVWHDVYDWSERLRPGGLMCGDDWLLESVRTAVENVAESIGLAPRNSANFWWLEPADLGPGERIETVAKGVP